MGFGGIVGCSVTWGTDVLVFTLSTPESTCKAHIFSFEDKKKLSSGMLNVRGFIDPFVNNNPPFLLW